MVRTKILATLGPASIDKIEELIKAGADGIRFNMAHKTPNDYEFWGNIVKQIKTANKNVFLVADLEGPKIRLGSFEAFEIKTGDEITIVPASIYSATNGKKEIPIQLKNLYEYGRGNSLLLVDDGKVGLRVKNYREGKIYCVVEYGEILEKRKGVNVPGIKIPIPNFSENDHLHLKFLIENNFDYIFLSYTRTAEAIKELKVQLEGTGIRVGGKPENQEGLDNLESIIKEADIMMVPRGDLGMEIGVINVPAYQKRIIEKCNIIGKPVITATQMLESMMENREPKRAEVADIFNAVLDGTDMVMLSGETSIGKYPVEAVKMMNSITEKAEEYLFDERSGINLGETLDKLIKINSSADLISKLVYTASKAPYIKAILVPTSSGYTAQMITRLRLNKPIIALTYNEKVKRQLNAVWGLTPILTQQTNEEAVVENAIKLAKQKGYVNKGDKVIITTGVGGGKGSTNMLRIEEVR